MLEVQGLTLVDKVEYAVSVKCAGAVAQCGQVGGGVQVAAVGFLHDDGQRVAFLVLVFVHEDALGALVFTEQALAGQVRDHVWQVVVVGTFAAYIVCGQADAEAVINGLTVTQRNGVELAPQFQTFRVMGLQLDHQATGPGGERLRFVEALFGGTVEAFQVAQFAGQFGGALFVLLLFQIGEQHAELGPPVAHVVLANHVVTQEFQRSYDCIADDGRTQVPHVHFLGQVRGGVVHHYGLDLLWAGHGQMRICQRLIQQAVEPVAGLKEVDKAGPGNLGLGNGAVLRQGGNQLVGQVAWLHAGGFGQHQRDVGGEIAVALVLGAVDLHRALGVGRQRALGDQGVESGFNQGNQAFFHGVRRGRLTGRRLYGKRAVDAWVGLFFYHRG